MSKHAHKIERVQISYHWVEGRKFLPKQVPNCNIWNLPLKHWTYIRAEFLNFLSACLTRNGVLILLVSVSRIWTFSCRCSKIKRRKILRRAGSETLRKKRSRYAVVVITSSTVTCKQKECKYCKHKHTAHTKYPPIHPLPQYIQKSSPSITLPQKQWVFMLKLASHAFWTHFLPVLHPREKHPPSWHPRSHTEWKSKDQIVLEDPQQLSVHVISFASHFCCPSEKFSDVVNACIYHLIKNKCQSRIKAQYKVMAVQL